jgi:hypothetical protein
MKLDGELYKELELLPEPVSEFRSISLNLKALLGRFWQALVRSLTSGHEPRIWERTDRGNTQWYVYDPTTGQTVCLPSEKEVRMWLDQYYGVRWY